MSPRPETTAPRKRRLPSLGFAVVCAVYAGVAAFFLWGLSTPALDRVWTLHHELKAGRIGAPSSRDRAVLREAMVRHPELAQALLPHDAAIGLISRHDEGWLTRPEATIVRTAQAASGALRFEVTTAAERLPFTIAMQGDGWRERLEIREPGQHVLPLPTLTAPAEVIVVSLRGQGLIDDASVLGVRITFEGAPEPAS